MNYIYMAEYSDNGNREGYEDKRDAIIAIIKNYFQEIYPNIINQIKGNTLDRNDLFHLNQVQADIESILNEGYIEDYAYIDKFPVYSDVYGKGKEE